MTPCAGRPDDPSIGEWKRRREEAEKTAATLRAAAMQKAPKVPIMGFENGKLTEEDQQQGLRSAV